MGYRVDVLQTSQSFEVDTSESVLEAALRQDVQLAHECTFGGCGTCRLKIVEGSVDYEEFPMALTPEEAQQGYALACQARPRSDLMISAEPALQAICRAAAGHGARQGSALAHARGGEPAPRAARSSGFQLPAGPVHQRPSGRRHASQLFDGVAAERRHGGISRAPHSRRTLHRCASWAGCVRATALEVELPLGSFRFHEEDEPSDPDGGDRHRPGADQEHPRVADGRRRLPAGIAVLGHAHRG